MDSKFTTVLRVFYKIVIIATILGLIFFPGIKEYLESIFNPNIFYDDERQFLPSFHQYLPNPIPTDYIKDYYLNSIIPLGFKGVMKFIYTHTDVQLALGLIKITVLIATALMVGIVAWEIGGSYIAFSSVALFFSSPIFFWIALNGVTPRIIGYSLILTAILCIIRKKIYPLAVFIILGSFIYPQAAFIAGNMMAIWLLLLPKNNILTANDWRVNKKLGVLIITACICLIPIIPLIMAGMSYGERLTSVNLLEYPEIGKGGRYLVTDSLPYNFLLSDLFYVMLNTIGNNVVNIYLFIITYLFILFVIGSNIKNVYEENPKTTSLFILIAAGFSSHIIAYLCAPYLYIPSRYIFYTLPVFLVLVVPIAMEKSFQKLLPNNKSLPAVITALLIGLYSLSGNKSISASFFAYDENEINVGNFIETLPTNVVIAGWPEGFVNNIPLLGHRNVLLTFETHQVFTKDYVEEMRRRTYAIIDVYFSTSIHPLVKLRDDFGVTHFIVEKGYFSGQYELKYFMPFNEVIEKNLQAMLLKESILQSEKLKFAVIFENENVKLLDLSRL